jgi:hypothetical protein
MSGKDPNYQITTSPVFIEDNHSVLLTSVTQSQSEREDSPQMLFVGKQDKVYYWEEDFVILCEAGEGNDRNWVDFSAGGERDDNGNDRVWGSAGYHSKDFNVKIDGHAKRDTDGNISGGGQVTIEVPIGK